MSYRAGIGQGNTSDAGDCMVFYNNLAAKYGSSNVIGVGFNTSTGAISGIATVANYRSGTNFDVVYWSSHGNSTPKLNYGDSTEFYSGQEAYNYWRHPTNRLKVVILAACYQFDGNTNRSRWANNIMRQSNIRAMAGYHVKGPTNPYDTNIATKFFDLCDDGNSIWYSWKNANAITSKGKDYLVLVYYDNGRCYYRMPGYPGNTYAAPDRENTKIYRYAGTISNQEVPKNTATSVNVASTPYELELYPMLHKSVKSATLNEAAENKRIKTAGSVFYRMRENASVEISSQVARHYNVELLSAAVDSEIADSALVDVYDDTMAEVLEDGKEGTECVIGATTRFCQHYNGILLEGNCIASVSDANGVIALSDQWQPTRKLSNNAQIDLAHKDLELFKAALRVDGSENIEFVDAQPVYLRKGERYVLHYEVTDSRGISSYIDAKAVES